ncbi:hypothetical protein PAXINDRAFT_88102 [Paxillus involutus ATCC 200175]|uniref:Uncharacterized protein n=1 Tax=Paxillus involutus ATCC 200175 TaxID=664439 RepID=A0A0C9SPH9_PAXIN|nr:hypothetical protein PAXINDRAFT_88102 [Paxillus involutus ATCC 200175]
MHDSSTQLTRHASYSGSTAPQGGHYHSNSHHLTHHRSRSRPPGAPSHRYVSSTTQPVYGHVSSGNVNASRTSFDAGVPSSRNHHATSPPPGTSSTSNRPGASPNNVSSRSHSRSRSHTRPPPSPTTITTTTAHASTKRRETHTYTPDPTPAATDIHRSTQRPGFPANYDGHTQTRYMNMLLALDDIPPLFNLMASFFTWILLAGFVLFPGTFASWKNQNTSETETQILGLINKISLYVFAWICTGIGGCGMTWLWWKWQNNYIWITNRVFIPGLLNSVAGIISTLASIYGAQAGTFGAAEKSTVIVTGVIAGICGLLVIIYQFVLLRNLKKEHDREVGVEKAGKHGEGVLGEKKSRQRSEV